MMTSISLSSFIKNFSYLSRQAVVRVQLVLAMIVLWGAGVWLRNEYGQDDSNLWLVMGLFLKLVLWTLVGLCVLSVVVALVTWIIFKQALSKKSIQVQVKFGDGQKAEAGLVPLSVGLIGNVLRPMLGTVQAQLIFSGKRVSEKIILDGNIPKPRHWWRSGIRGSGKTLLHDRGIYDVEKVLVSFCDMLGLISLPATIPFVQQLYTLPHPQPEQKVKAQPNATEEQMQRIDIPKRVEGEHVNYKEFETGDNIQRIVWKIYAKSGELVVRIPETKDPYASHLYFYVSYFNGLGENGAFETELLNVYKDQVRNLFESLQRNGYEVRMPHDQETPKLSGVSEKKNDLFQITAASWQQQMPASKFVNVNKAAFVCLSALTPASELEMIIKNLPENVPVVVVKLSDAIPSPFQITVKDIFFKPEPQPTDALRQPWLLSSLRRELAKNEKKIGEVLKRRGNGWMVERVGV
jgi:Protein of unknown function DUF58